MMAQPRRPLPEPVDVRRTIVVVEDDSGIRRLIKLTLEGFDHDLVMTVDGLSGWEKTRELLPDLVILDLALPEIDGWEFLQRVRMHSACRGIPVLVVTAHGQGSTARVVAEHGGNGYLEKPFRPNDLRRAVSDLLSPRVSDGE